ncbi:A/G-specific adenine glycosylase [Noviluteimonas gilva]|uniref:Adenine DNA glycosylase n=1 Tax=Noviluteimonas gilva TaxID=2682097 RepID=A0A7C9MNL9_9GAMM|nr:A/G-specific adenine glycosylase [Lysobacter gilvus]MUV15407.1 A/G-specific adenine glycosylase [Lysobacter gilvus]
MIEPDSFAGRLLAWFELEGRHDLPWQHPRAPYRVWLSEVMLQQTQVRVVIPYFERFVAVLPDVRALAAAPLDDVIALWAGLGYYARARNLHAAAKACVELHDGELPRDLDALMALPGIGRSTAGAILSQAWGDRFPILDGNVKRVLARIHGIEGYPGLPAIEKRMWAIAEAQLPDARMADYTQAQMDLGATLCTRADPACILCPMQSTCVALREGRTAELPTPKPGKPLPERSALMLWIEDAQGRVLLQRRPAAGIWGSLWSFPEHADRDAARAWFAEHIAAEFESAETLAPVAHGFTHYRLQIQPLRWRGTDPPRATSDNGDLRWIPRASLGTLGLPAPVRKLLEG